MNEDDAITVLRARLGGGRSGVESIGDDAVVLRAGDGRVAALDALVEGVHFDLRWSSPADAAFKALATNVSDLWAMGAEPRAWLLGLGLPPERADDTTVGAIADGFVAAIEALDLDIALVGGDTVRSPGGLLLSVTVLGACDGEPLTRAGARPGQALFVDGPLGHAAAGLALLAADRSESVAEAHVLVEAHRRPRPRRLLASAARRAGISACLDVSDGLARDVARLASASGVGVEIDGALPGVEQLREAAEQLRVDPGPWQLHGGDDYVKLVAADAAPGPAWHPVGRVVDARAGLTLLQPDGSRGPLVAEGFEHFAKHRRTHSDR